MEKIVLATNNKGKVREFNSMLGDNYRLLSQQDLGIESVAETGFSFVENSLIKARHAAEKSKLPAIADDSGIVVEALNGAPGIYSSRYAGKNASDKENREKLLQEIEKNDNKNRKAYFCCAIVYLKNAHDPMPIIVQAKWHGEIAKKPQGVNGFGYDSIFYLQEYNCTSSQLSAEFKNSISHRGKAIKSFLEIMTKK